MNPASRPPRRRTAAGIAVLLGLGLLALAAYCELDRRATAREIARLTDPRDKLRAIAARLETQRGEAESDKWSAWNVLSHCRSAEDIPDLGGNRIVAQNQGFEKLCLYVPEGSHTLEVATTIRPKPPGIEGVEPVKKTWRVPLLPGCGYLLKLVSHRKAGPVDWELSSNHPEFPTQTESVIAAGFAQRGSSWSGTDVVAFPNQVQRFTIRELETAATDRAGISLMQATLNGVLHNEPCEIALDVRLASQTPACVSATDAQRIIVLGSEHLLEPYAGEGKYDLRIPVSTNAASQ